MGEKFSKNERFPDGETKRSVSSNGGKRSIPGGSGKSRPPGSKDWRFPLDAQAKEKSLAAIQRAAEEKQLRYHPSFWAKLWNQFRFQSWKHRASKGAVLLLAMLLAFWLNQKDVPYFESIAACSVFLVFAGNLCLSGLGRLFSWHMAELEQTLYLNLKQMVCIGMLEAGIVDLAVLSFLAVSTGGRGQTAACASLLYMLVPFLWSDILYLQMLTTMRNSQNEYLQLAAGIVCGLLALFPLVWENPYRADYLPLWGGAAITGVLLLAAQIYRILGKIEGGDGLCLN